MPKTIIVPLDGSPSAERALVPAFALAQQAHATLVTVIARPGGVPDAERYLQSALRGAGAESARTMVFDDRLAASAITTLAGTEPDPMICMTTHARSGPSQALFGSVAEEVIRRADVPLVLVGPSVADAGSWMFEELIVCLDGSAAASEVLPVATTLARDLGLTMSLVEVLDPDSRTDGDPTARADVAESARLQELAPDLASSELKVNWETLHGHDPASAIIRFVETRPSPILAMTTHGRSGLARVTAGSVTMSVVRRAPCPVLVTRSHGLAG